MGIKLDKSNSKRNLENNSVTESKLNSKEVFDHLFSKENVKPLSIQEIKKSRLSAYSPVF